MKILGENKVPRGCYYDPADKYAAFRERLDDSIFASLEQTEEAILKEFSITKNDIIYEACINRKWRTNVNLAQIKTFTDDVLIRGGDDPFSLQLIINCKKQLNAIDVQIWGTVVDILYCRDEWYVELEDEYYPVWLISIQDISTTIDDPFSADDLGKIRTSILDEVRNDYNEFYSKP